MLRTWSIAAALLVHATGCSHVVRTSADADLSEEDRVYLALLSVDAAQPSPLVRIVSDSTGGPIQLPVDTTGLQAFGGVAEQLPGDLLSSFLARRNDRVALSERMLARLPERLIVRSSIPAELVESPEDGTFLLPDGRAASITTFSRVGFDASGQRALVHEQWLCGPRCGGTTLILLERAPSGRWHVVERRSGWVF